MTTDNDRVTNWWNDPESANPQPFPTGILPQPLKDFVCRTSDALGVDPAFIALPSFAALGAAIGNSRHVKLKRSWCEPPIFWCVAIGVSGSGKSPAFNAALKPLQELQTLEFQRYDELLELYEGEIEQFEYDLKRWEKTTRDPEQKPAKPQPPVAKRYVVDDITTEALAAVITENARGVLMASDELFTWFKGFDSYRGGKGGDVGRWLKLWESKPMTIDRKSSKTLYVPMASACVCGCIQPTVLSETLGQLFIENGMAARLLMCTPRPRAEQWTEREVPIEATEDIKLLYAGLTKLNLNNHNGVPCPVIVPLSPGAKRIWVNFHDAWKRRQNLESLNDQGMVLAKLLSYGARFSLLFYLVKVVAGELRLSDQEAIDEESMSMGIQMTLWFAGEAMRAYRIMGETVEAKRARKIIELIQAAGGMIRVRDLQRSTHASAADIRDDLKAMAGDGVGVMEYHRNGTRGKDTEYFRLSQTFAGLGIAHASDSKENAGDTLNSDVTTNGLTGTEGLNVAVTASKEETLKMTSVQ